MSGHPQNATSADVRAELEAALSGGPLTSDALERLSSLLDRMRGDDNHQGQITDGGSGDSDSHSGTSSRDDIPTGQGAGGSVVSEPSMLVVTTAHVDAHFNGRERDGVQIALFILNLVHPLHTRLVLEVPLSDLGETGVSILFDGLKEAVEAGGGRSFRLNEISICEGEEPDMSSHWWRRDGGAEVLPSSPLSIAISALLDESAAFPDLATLSVEANFQPCLRTECCTEALKIVNNDRLKNIDLARSSCQSARWLSVLKHASDRMERSPGSLDCLFLPKLFATRRINVPWYEEVESVLLRIIQLGRNGLLVFSIGEDDWSFPSYLGRLSLPKDAWFAIVEAALANRTLWQFVIPSPSLQDTPAPDDADWVESAEDGLVEPLAINRRNGRRVQWAALRVLVPTRVLLHAKPTSASPTGHPSPSAPEGLLSLPIEVRVVIIRHLSKGYLSAPQIGHIVKYAAEFGALDWDGSRDDLVRGYLKAVDCLRWQDGA